jgi:ferredoxin
MSVSSSKGERVFLKRVREHADQVIWAPLNADQEGFDYFQCDEFIRNHSVHGSLVKDKFLSMPRRNLPKMLNVMRKNIISIMRGREACFSDLNQYLDQMDETGILIDKGHPRMSTYPNQDLWEALRGYAWEKWQVLIGFTEMPEQLIFKGKAVLFKYALVCIQEMAQEKIALAPELEAGEEVLHVYNTLGIAVNDIANWLRKNEHIKCQSNHPLGGLVNTTPLAAKAGMGWQGQNGLLITPQFGQRQRIAPIFIESKLFEYTDNQAHTWIEDFCQSCKKCQRACPVQAIYDERKVNIQDVPGIGQTKTCIDRVKCYPKFNETLGCSICVSVCPFSRGGQSYEKIKKGYEKKQRMESISN